MAVSVTSHKGQIAELTVALDLARKGFSISWPVPNDVYDLIATRGEQVLRIQVKTVRWRLRDGKQWLVLDLTDGAGHRYEKGTVDYFTAYDPNDGRLYYLSFGSLDGARERWIDPSKIYQLL